MPAREIALSYEVIQAVPLTGAYRDAPERGISLTAHRNDYGPTVRGPSFQPQKHGRPLSVRERGGGATPTIQPLARALDRALGLLLVALRCPSCRMFQHTAPSWFSYVCGLAGDISSFCELREV